MSKAEQVANAFVQRFPDCKDYSSRPSIDEIEQFMRPFAPISYEVQRRIDELLSGKDLSKTTTGLHHWWEANFAVSGDGPRHPRVLNFLIGDPCTCVVPHLVAAIEHATDPVDSRLIKLRDVWIKCGQNENKFHQLLKQSSD